MQELKIEYWQWGGAAAMGLGWRPAVEKDSKKAKVVPAGMLWHEPPAAPAPLAPAPGLPGDDGRIVLPAGTASVRPPIFYENPGGGPVNLGSWRQLDAWAEWELELPGGDYAVEIEAACWSGHAGSEVELTTGGQRLTWT